MNFLALHMLWRMQITTNNKHRIIDCGIADVDSDCNCLYGCTETRPPPRHEIESVKEWIRQWFDVRKTINDMHSSYLLKHIMERHTDFYVSNGAFIQAAIELGYRYKRCSCSSVNAYFNASYKRIDKLFDEINR